MTSAILEYVILAGSSLSRTKTLGQLAASLRILSTLRTQGPALSLVLRVAGCNSRAGLVRFPLAQADYELGYVGNERYAWRIEPSPPFNPHAPATRNIAMSVASSTLLTVFLRMPAWRPGRVQQVPFLRASFWRGLYLQTQHRPVPAGSLFGRLVVRLRFYACGCCVLVSWLVSWSSCVLNMA